MPVSVGILAREPVQARRKVEPVDQIGIGFDESIIPLVARLNSDPNVIDIVLVVPERPPKGILPSGVRFRVFAELRSNATGKARNILLSEIKDTSAWTVLLDSDFRPDSGYFEALGERVPPTSPTLATGKTRNRNGERFWDICHVRSDLNTAVIPYDDWASPTFKQRSYVAGHQNIFNNPGLKLARSFGGYPEVSVSESKILSEKFRKHGGTIDFYPELEGEMSILRPPVSEHDDFISR